MVSSEDMAQRHGRILTELSELGLSLARSLHARAEAAESPADAQSLALAFHRIARDVRLTMALESRLAHERIEIVRDEQAQARLRTLERKTQVRKALSHAIWRETEGEAAERLIEDLGERLEVAALFETFLQGPVEATIARIRADLGLPANDASASDAASGSGPTDWRSSA